MPQRNHQLKLLITTKQKGRCQRDSTYIYLLSKTCMQRGNCGREALNVKKKRSFPKQETTDANKWNFKLYGCKHKSNPGPRRSSSVLHFVLYKW